LYGVFLLTIEPFLLSLVQQKGRSLVEQERHFIHIHDQLCPYCRDEVKGCADLCSCPTCATIHHQECWEESGQVCSSGCETRVEAHQQEIDKLENELNKLKGKYQLELRLFIVFFIPLIILMFWRPASILAWVGYTVLAINAFVPIFGLYLFRKEKRVLVEKILELKSTNGS
jgi:hypothetical protein